MLVETAFGILVLLAWRKVRGRKGMTKERKDIYLAALEHLSDPKALRELADGFEKDGLPIEATMLRKRADLRAMPREKWENYRALCERAISKPDSNPEALDEMASGFDALTATGTAAKLRKRAAERRMEILAYAEEQERARQNAAEEAARKAQQAQADTKAPKDSEKTIDPDDSASHVAQVVEEVPTSAQSAGEVAP
jgi:hypothetical protein